MDCGRQKAGHAGHGNVGGGNGGRRRHVLLFLFLAATAAIFGRDGDVMAAVFRESSGPFFDDGDS